MCRTKKKKMPITRISEEKFVCCVVALLFVVVVVVVLVPSWLRKRHKKRGKRFSAKSDFSKGLSEMVKGKVKVKAHTRKAPKPKKTPTPKKAAGKKKPSKPTKTKAASQKTSNVIVHVHQ
jgi:hypothetical protein